MYRGRLAPTPTGLLHLGHARTFWTAQQRARDQGGILIYRNEDLDPARCKPEFCEAAIEDLRWLGLKWEGEPIDLAMGHVNQIWQGDANSYLARSFPLCRSPTKVLNLTGRVVLSVRQMAERLGEELGREPIFQGEEGDTALLGEGSRLFDEFGPAGTDIDEVIRWMANWTRSSGRSLGKPTKYDSRKGEF